jgi:citrate lyase beta subunit
MPLNRSNFSVGADDDDLVEFALDSAADNVILDLEDQVAPADKEAAMENVLDALVEGESIDKGFFVRVNGLDTERGISDIRRVVESGTAPDSFMIPDTDSAEEIRLVSDVLDSLDVDCGIIPLVESPSGVFDADRIARASPRVTGLSFGTADFRLRMGINTQNRDADLYIPRYTISMAANAAGIFPMDTPYIYRNDVEGLREDALRMRAIGYRGKFCAIPEQIEHINEVFTPSEDEIARAKEVIREFDEAGTGVMYVGDTFIDRPIANEQRRLVKRAIEAGVDVDVSDVRLEET